MTKEAGKVTLEIALAAIRCGRPLPVAEARAGLERGALWRHFRREVQAARAIYEARRRRGWRPPR